MAAARKDHRGYKYQAVELGNGQYEAQVWPPGAPHGSVPFRFGSTQTAERAEELAREWIDKDIG